MERNKNKKSLSNLGRPYRLKLRKATIISLQSSSSSTLARTNLLSVITKVTTMFVPFFRHWPQPSTSFQLFAAQSCYKPFPT